jgi:glycosyltransferase involved in cell wall biosynthesis
VAAGGQPNVLVLNYYQPWTYAGSERFLQLAREELRQGRDQAFVYVADAGGRDVIDRNVLLPEYSRLALYEFVPPGRARPVSPYANQLTGTADIELPALAAHLRPTYVRAHYPAADFVPVLESEVLRDVPFVYDLMDLWDEFRANPWGDSEVEAYYAKRADTMIAVSQSLVDRFAGAVPVHLVPNAVDRLFLRRIAPDKGCERLPGTPKRVLYMGGMAGCWFDWDIVRALPRRLPDHRFTLLGSAEPPPEEEDIVHLRRCQMYLAELAALPNVRVAPEVPHDELVPWLREADVGLIPFLKSDLVTAVSPLKVYEYLGAGMPVVQVGMPDIEPYPGVRTADSLDQFVELVRQSDRATLSGEEAATIARFAESNTWHAVMTRFDEITGGLA